MALKWARSESPLECSPVVKAHLSLKLLKLPEAHIPTSQGPCASLVPGPLIQAAVCRGRGALPSTWAHRGGERSCFNKGFLKEPPSASPQPATPACPVMTCLGSLFQRHTQAPPRETLTPWGWGVRRGPLGTLLGDHDNHLGGEPDGTNGSRILES